MVILLVLQKMYIVIITMINLFGVDYIAIKLYIAT